MRLDFSLDTKQTQKLKLTQEMKQSIEILQMSIQELDKTISEELDSNPVLEESTYNTIDWEKYVLDIKNKIKYKEYHGNEYADEDVNPENFIATNMSLYDYLENEIIHTNFSEKEKEIAYAIIKFVDERGYFIGDINNIAKELNTKENDVLNLLFKLQKIESNGMFARDLKECICLQIDEKLDDADIITTIIKENLEEIAQKKYSLLQKKYKLNKEKLNKILKTIKNFNPKPGNRFSDFKPTYIIPDVVVEKYNDSFEIVDVGYSTRLYLNDFYKELVITSEDEEAKEYIKDKLNKAVNLIKNIERRKKTINKVAKAIVEYQEKFFYSGEKNIIPMKLKDISEKTGFHESTISRAINGKYMLTNLGIFEFKYFFKNAINTSQDEDVSSQNIKEKIKRIISNENKNKPLSDNNIVEILKADKINISRRTVAKYREEMGINSSSQRKEIY